MKYKLTDETITIDGHTLHRIKALENFGNVKRGDKGGWVERESNLSQNGNAKVYGNAQVGGNAQVAEKEDYIVFKNSWSSGRYFTYTSTNKMWRVGCFYGTGEGLVAKAYKDSGLSGKCYAATVRYVEEIERLKKEVGKC